LSNLKSELSILHLLSISCIECHLSLAQAENFWVFFLCVFICYRFRGLNQFEEGRIVTKYVFRIACSVRVCTENIIKVRSLFSASCFVCQSSFSFSFSFSYIRLFVVLSIPFNWFRLQLDLPSFCCRSCWSFLVV
jgi:hypothetical protein